MWSVYRLCQGAEPGSIHELWVCDCGLEHDALHIVIALNEFAGHEN
jgi:hypothetical protein